jgi:hypothetical protein
MANADFLVARDIEGTSRSQGPAPDIGAFEMIGGTPRPRSRRSTAPPTSGSWRKRRRDVLLNPPRRRLKRGVFRSIVDLQAAIHWYLAEQNHDPKPFV